MKSLPVIAVYSMILVRAAPTQSYTPWHVRQSTEAQVERTLCETLISADHSEVLDARLLIQANTRMAPLCTYCLQALVPA